jgi:hypothetical protein
MPFWIICGAVQTRDGSIFQTYWPGEPKPGKPKVWTGNPAKAKTYNTEADAKGDAIAIALNRPDNVLDVWVERLTNQELRT